MTKFIHTRAHGTNGESQVAAYLENLGFTILERNYTQRYGEIDLIAQRDDLIVFVEVKMRTTTAIDPGELVGPSKQKKIMLTAAQYIATHPQEVSYRFDVACVVGEDTCADIIYIPEAFHGYS